MITSHTLGEVDGIAKNWADVHLIDERLSCCWRIGIMIMKLHCFLEARSMLLSIVLLCFLSGFIMVEESQGSTDATCLVYQAIDMQSEGSVISTPKHGLIVLAVPYLNAFSVSEYPYYAITKPYKMLSMRGEEGVGDSNIISRAGIMISSRCVFEGNKVKEETVTVDFSKFDEKMAGRNLAVVAEATLECIRCTATDVHQKWRRPILDIVGKAEDEEKWKLWIEAFNQHDFTKPFIGPEVNDQ